MGLRRDIRNVLEAANSADELIRLSSDKSARKMADFVTPNSNNLGNRIIRDQAGYLLHKNLRRQLIKSALRAKSGDKTRFLNTKVKIAEKYLDYKHAHPTRK